MSIAPESTISATSIVAASVTRRPSMNVDLTPALSSMRVICGVAMRIKVMVKATFAAALVAMSVNHARAGSLNPSASDRLIGDFRSIPDALVLSRPIQLLALLRRPCAIRHGIRSFCRNRHSRRRPSRMQKTQHNDPLQSCGSIAAGEVGRVQDMQMNMARQFATLPTGGRRRPEFRNVACRIQARDFLGRQ